MSVDGHEHAEVAAAAGALGADLSRWLASGAVQSPDGAFHAWLDADTGELAFAYPEITGYAVTWLAGRANATDAERAAARRACDWLIGRLDAGRWTARDGWDHDAVYVFDLAMIATGLLTFGRVTQDAKAIAAGSAIVADIQRQQEREHPLRSLSHRSPASSERSAWSTEGYAHLIKVVQCLLLGAEIGVPRSREAASTLIGRAGGLQQADGRFVTHHRDGPTMLHPHLYAVEGFWMCAEATGDETARARARRGIDWAWSTQLEDGGRPRSSPGPGAPAQADLTAQAVRMGVLLGSDPTSIARAFRWLESIAGGDQRGCALHYQEGEPHLNTWATLFGAQAVSLLAGSGPLDWRVLV